VVVAVRVSVRRVQLREFVLERYFARWEFAVRFNLCASDVEAVGMEELLGLADEECRGLWRGLRLGYTESQGHPLLRAEIAGLYAGLVAEDVLVFSGAEEALFCGLQVLLGPGDHAVVTVPAYQSLVEVARASGAAVTTVALRAEDGWRLDVEALGAALREDTKILIINAPHNPTGMLPDAATWRRVQELAAERGVRLVIDEAYRGLEYDDADRLVAGAELAASGISVGVMSKAYGLAGLRIGWLATRDREVLARAAAFKDYTTICAAAPSELLALVGLRARDVLVARSREIVLANLELAADFFARREDVFEWIRPRAGTVAFPRLRRGDAEDFVARLVEAEGVLLLPGSCFDGPGPHFRVGLGRRDFAAGLGRLGVFVDSLPRGIVR